MTQTQLMIKIAKDFTRVPGARTYDDGKFSGQEFYDKILSPKFREAIGSESKLVIDLDGTEGYASSFLNEAFRRLAREYNSDYVWEHLEIVSNEVPKYISKVKESIYEDS